ncbi:MAG: sugar phosphate isomerase/epimerase [Acidobacteria bacterium]|nr:sugar phosphate isomerase/epimerase [Acidobacteriota bacterium]
MTNDLTRKEFLQALAGAAAIAAVPTFTACSAPKSKIKLGVCTYSYNGDLQQGRMNLEDCVADMADLGAEGIEFLGEALVPNFPNPDEQWFDWLKGVMEKYNIKPIAYTGFIDTRLYRNRALSAQEIAQSMEPELKIMNKLGFKLFRGLGSSWEHALALPPDSVWAKAGVKMEDVYDEVMPLLDKYDVTISEEIHSPERLGSDLLKRIVDYVDKTKTHRIGLCPDMGIFQDRMRRSTIENYYAQAGRQNIVDFILKNFEDNIPQERILEEVKKMGGNETELRMAGPSGIYHGSYNNANRNKPEDLAKYVPYIKHVHGKFWEMTEDLKEYSIPYDKVIPVLIKGGFDGYICSEYEGNRNVFQAQIQLRRQHYMIRQLLAKA